MSEVKRLSNAVLFVSVELKDGLFKYHLLKGCKQFCTLLLSKRMALYVTRFEHFETFCHACLKTLQKLKDVQNVLLESEKKTAPKKCLKFRMACLNTTFGRFVRNIALYCI